MSLDGVGRPVFPDNALARVELDCAFRTDLSVYQKLNPSLRPPDLEWWGSVGEMASCSRKLESCRFKLRRASTYEVNDKGMAVALVVASVALMVLGIFGAYHLATPSQLTSTEAFAYGALVGVAPAALYTMWGVYHSSRLKEMGCCRATLLIPTLPLTGPVMAVWQNFGKITRLQNAADSLEQQIDENLPALVAGYKDDAEMLASWKGVLEENSTILVRNAEDAAFLPDENGLLCYLKESGLSAAVSYLAELDAFMKAQN